MIRTILLAIGFAIVLPNHLPAAETFAACAQHFPYGEPELATDVPTTAVCHRGYATLHDDDNLIPRYVVYRLTAAHTLGCEKRSNKFHPEASLSAEHRATPQDYIGSGYDRGHMAPAGDFAWSKAMSLDSFSMANMSPQLPGLNRQQWERLEETVRTWAYARGELAVMVGPVIPKRPKAIGDNEVSVPSAFWKALIDLATHETIAFEMPQQAIAKGNLASWQVPISKIEHDAEIRLPLPEGTDTEATPDLWPADRTAWNSAKQQNCTN